MNRQLIIFLLVAISILPATLEGQGRGGRSGFGHRGSTFQDGRPQVGIRQNPGPGVAVMRPAPPIAVARPGVPFGRRPFVGRPFHRPVIIGQPFGFQSPFYSPFFSPFYSPTPIYGAPIYGSSIYPPAVNTAPPEPPPVSQNDLDLSYQVGRLTQEVEQLRQEQTLRQPAQPAVTVPAIPTVLVFRDGHRLSIVNYMIVGETLWVADEQAATKIPLSDLDLDATRKENRERGVRFLR
ncbi:MAG TPA: hypothetical protein VE422_41030 [Terriglobia bacterium]|nr:hypothetical protein [Terriglobia bacterium]